MTCEAKRGISLLRRSLRAARVPEYWHKNSPKTYTVHQHAVLLVFRRRMHNVSYDDFVELWLPAMRLPEWIGLEEIPNASTLCREEARLLEWLESTNVKLIQAILPERVFSVGDGTGLQTRHASSYYIRRILGQNGRKRRGYARLVFVGTTKNLILGAGIRLLPRGELHILRRIWNKLARKPSTLIWDGAADSEAHHIWLAAQGVRSIAPVRRGWRKGKHRRKLATHFPEKTYGKRNHAETIVKLWKHQFGEALKARKVRSRRAEIATCALAHNLWQRLRAAKKFVLYELCNITPSPQHFKTRAQCFSLWKNLKRAG